MSSFTEKLRLKIFDGTDLVKRADFNANWQKIEEGYQSLEDSLTQHTDNVDNAHDVSFREFLYDIFGCSWVLSGLDISKNITINNKLDVTSGTIYIQVAENKLRRVTKQGTSFTTSSANASYYLEILPDLTWYWDTTPSGISGSITLARVTTDNNGNIATIEDLRPLKPEKSKIRTSRDILVVTANHGDIVNHNLSEIPDVAVVPLDLRTYDADSPNNPQKIIAKAINVTGTSFEVVCGLYKEGDSQSANINTTLTSVGSNYTTNDLDPDYESVTYYQINGYVTISVVSLQGFPGPLGYAGARIRLEGSNNGGTNWTTLWEGNILFYTDWNPWSAPEYRTWTVSFNIGKDVLAGNWRFRTTFVSKVIGNSNFGWNGTSPTVTLASHEYNKNVLKVGGKALCYIIPKA